jgi:hypothetical protein
VKVVRSSVVGIDYSQYRDLVEGLDTKSQFIELGCSQHRLPGRLCQAALFVLRYKTWLRREIFRPINPS